MQVLAEKKSPCGVPPQQNKGFKHNIQKNKFSEMLDMVIFQKMCFRQKLDLWVTYLERYLIKVVRMDRTDHLDFR